MKAYHLMLILAFLSACGLPTGPEVLSDESISAEETSPFTSIAGQWQLVEIRRTNYSHPDTTVGTWESILTPDMQASSLMKLNNGVIDLNGDVIFYCDSIFHLRNNGQTTASHTSWLEFSINQNIDSTFSVETGFYYASYRLQNGPWIDKPAVEEKYTYTQPWRIEGDLLMIPIEHSYVYMTGDCYEPPYAIRYDVGVFEKVAVE